MFPDVAANVAVDIFRVCESGYYWGWSRRSF